ncbi:Ribosome-recycling factor, mitochondrial [Strongyloides ratti]|uniref:Ribosome-recycling factor, mitochondrial n=1 Tax=Strongyloides ratti TaxID=34506 RepID=A0A090L905_STRRB|nr:Ribosome-recycling factor, mitochondrial [Strongyloides ratti]CEF66241.1 Ribosome-recycling factor, mitochondrial [Strongyloides ratti]
MATRFLSLLRTIASYSGAKNLCRNAYPLRNFQYRSLTLSPPLNKIKKSGDKNASKTKISVNFENQIIREAKNEMEEIERILAEELTKHFSLQVDLRIYEDILVDLEDGSTKKMKHIGRISCKNNNMIAINFSDNPTLIKNAKLALQKSSLNINPQQEGVVLYISIPKMTRERREALANSAKSKVFNEYKNALNKVYIDADEKSTKTVKIKDEAQKNRTALLALKRAMEARGLAMVESKQKALLSEIA